MVLPGLRLLKKAMHHLCPADTEGQTLTADLYLPEILR